MRDPAMSRAEWTGLLKLLSKDMRRLRISAIAYLNTAPLMWDFEHSEPGESRAASHFDISYTLPSQCAANLQLGSADLGIIPAAAYASIPDLMIIPEVAIASRRPVRSILLVSRLPLEEIKSVALDTSSLTSVALTQVLFAKYWKQKASFRAAAPDLERMLEQSDAALLIGDPALQVDRAQYLTYDLAEEWIRFTGKPFVFAFWALRKDALKDAAPSLDLATIFRESRDHGLRNASLDRIAHEWAPRLNLTAPSVRSYLTENIHYSLDAECLDGLRLFYSYGAEIGVLPQAPELHFLETAKPAIR
jgi:chorismate dehydratase